MSEPRASYVAYLAARGNVPPDHCVFLTPIIPRLGVGKHLAVTWLMDIQVSDRPNAEQEAGGWFALDVPEWKLTTLLKSFPSCKYLSSALAVLERTGLVRFEASGESFRVWIDFDQFMTEWSALPQSPDDEEDDQ